MVFTHYFSPFQLGTHEIGQNALVERGVDVLYLGDDPPVVGH